MINEVLIKNTPQFKSELKLDNLNAVNFIFGNNGTGKTSISRILEKIDDYSDCSIKWENDIALQIMVYNRDYVENNFFSKENIEGIFTLGSDNVEAEKEIISLEKNKEQATSIHNSLLAQLNGYNDQKGKKKELEELEDDFVGACWQQKKNYDGIFKNAFKGNRGDRKDFKEKILKEYSNNTASLLPLDNLKEKISIVFNKDSEKQSELQLFDISNLIKIEKDPILSESIVGNQEIDLSFIIDKLGNSDWVKQGTHFHDKKRDTCPYCQQYTDQNILEKLNKLFDQNYEEKVNKVKWLKEEYQNTCNLVMQKFEQIKSSFLDEKLFKSETQVLKGILYKNIEKLKKKILEPSQVVSLDLVKDSAEKILELLNQANVKIKNNNTLVDNIEKEKEELTSQIWKYVIDGFRTNIEIYINNKNELKTHIDAINKKITSNDEETKKNNDKIKKLKEQCHSIEPIKNELNKLLEKFDFTSFHIETTEDGLYYQICRENGNNATCSLSEGEKTFITFLYFYWQIQNKNTLRRILENYFRIWGNWSNDDICRSFSGDEHRVCQSLFSWINDGSHFILDDLYTAPSDYSNELYLKVFEEVFQKTDQYSHYKMMMGIK